MDIYPLTFRPILKERVWGGRKLEQVYGKSLPKGALVGESWEICDRPGETNLVTNGELAGADLHSVVNAWGSYLLGPARLLNGRFPLLIKILDAQEKLSLQVHPPAEKARGLGGEPKTEIWYIAQAEPSAELYVGLKPGTARADFEANLQAGTVEQCFHRIPVRAGDTMFLPSGRVHAIGAGLVIFEIQQNSDTTYRVFDWNRVGLDGKPRQLHIRESLESIDFGDFAPALTVPKPLQATPARFCLLSDPLFSVELVRMAEGEELRLEPDKMWVLGVVQGTLTLKGQFDTISLTAGQFCLIPAAVRDAAARGTSSAEFLLVQAGEE